MAKKIPESSFSRFYSYLRLDRRDVLQIVDTLSSGKNGGQAKIVSEGYEYESIPELVEHFGSRLVKELRLSTREISVEIGKTRSHVMGHFLRPDDEAGVMARCVSIDDLLSARRRLVNDIVFLCLRMGVFMVAFVIAMFALYGRVSPWAAIAGTIISGAVVFVPYQTVIVLDDRHETFLRRNQEKILVGVLTAAATALVILGGQKIRERVWPDPVARPVPIQHVGASKP